ncbi:histidine phosphatase family protein [Mycobacterium sp.]|uniref:histidine phosphatase family protein n=1 Tax=Mycobacterium sp. TaxID=1785 RepID=UPI003BAB7C3B
MTDVVRLTLVSHAMTHAMVAGCFPADEPLNDTGRRQIKAACEREALALRGADSGIRQLAGPEQRVQQTAQLLGLQSATEPLLADLDCVGWRGKTLTDVDPAELHVWLTDPAQSPHGGESLVDLMGRVGEWMKTLESPTDSVSRTVAVTHPAVIRAAILIALGAAPKSFWRIDIAPVSCTTMNFRRGLWTLRLL